MKKQGLSRRDFLKQATRYSLILGGSGLLLSNPSRLLTFLNRQLYASPCQGDLIKKAPRARFWTSTAMPEVDCLSCHSPGEIDPNTRHDHEEIIVKCLLCARGCILKEGERGRCRARMNVKGEMRSLVYGRPISVHVDPVEKKPFFHFLPGSAAFSMATAGCPLSCQFCQNWEISQAKPEDYSTEYVSPDAIVKSTVSRKAPIIAFTYNEPTVFTEYLLDIARLGREQDIRCVMVSCGFMNAEPLTEMCEALDAIKIDLKGYSENFYRNVSHAELKPVLNSIKQVAKSNTHLEIVNLVVPTLNDSEKMLRELAEWVVGEIGPDVPVHFTRFHPDYKLLNLPPTPVATLERAREIALEKGIHYAYVGNVPGHPGNSTYCPNCGEVVIRRSSFFILEINMKEGRCKLCNHPVAGVWA
jgi:pyruvate formate lyase activating enzyme